MQANLLRSQSFSTLSNLSEKPSNFPTRGPNACQLFQITHVGHLQSLEQWVGCLFEQSGTSFRLKGSCESRIPDRHKTQAVELPYGVRMSRAKGGQLPSVQLLLLFLQWMGVP